MNRRREWIAATLATALPLPGFARAERDLPHPRSLAAELDAAVAARKSLVIMVSLRGCPYCKLVRESYLLPLRAQGQPVVQIEIDDALALVDVRGQPSTHADVARALGARLAPTVYFLGRHGRQAARPLVGVANADFYGAYLDERVAAANEAVAAS